MLAELLSLPYVSNAVGISSEKEVLLVTRQGDQGQEIITLPSPGLVTCSNDMNNPRIPGLKGIMQSKKKPVDVIALHDLISHIPDEDRSEEHTSELQSRGHLVCRLLLEQK